MQNKRYKLVFERSNENKKRSRRNFNEDKQGYSGVKNIFKNEYDSKRIEFCSFFI
jgi:hypothetical protein